MDNTTQPIYAKFCSICGAPNEGGCRFCQQCGNSLVVGSAEEFTAPSQPDRIYDQSVYQQNQANFQGQYQSPQYNGSPYQGQQYRDGAYDLGLAISTLKSISSSHIVCGILSIVCGVLYIGSILFAFAGILVIADGIVDICIGCSYSGTAKKAEAGQIDIHEWFRRNNGGITALAIINIIFGSIPGLVGGIYQLSIKGRGLQA